MVTASAGAVTAMVVPTNHFSGLLSALDELNAWLQRVGCFKLLWVR